MRKQTKVAALVSAAALLAIGASMTSFAAGWTTNEDGEATYKDSNDDVVPGFHKNPKWDSTKYYYVDPDSEVLAAGDDGSKIVEWEGIYYYVDSTGARAKYRWIEKEYDGEELINGTTPETVWYYVNSKGEIQTAESDVAVISTPKTDGAGVKKVPFVFDSDGHMLTGWVETADGWVYCDPEGTDGRVKGQVVMDDFIDLNTLDELSEEFMTIADENDPDEDGHVWVYCKKDTGLCTIDNGTYLLEKWSKDGRRYAFNENGVLYESTWLTADYTFTDKAAEGWYFAGDGGELKTNGWKSVQPYYAEDPADYYFRNTKKMGAGLEDGEIVDLWLNRVHYLFGSDGKLAGKKVVRVNVADVPTYEVTGTDNNITVVSTENSTNKVVANSLNELKIFYLGPDGKIVKSAAFDDDKGNNGYASKTGTLVGLDAADGAYAIIDGKLYQKKSGVDPYFKLVKAAADYAYVDLGKREDVAKIFYAKDTDGTALKATDKKNTYREGSSAYTNYQPYENGKAVDKKKDGETVDGIVRVVVDSTGTLVKVKDEEVMSVDGKAIAYLTTNKYGVVTSDDDLED